MTELPYPYTITRGHEPTPPLQTAIEKINVYSSQYAHLSPSECAALRAELKRSKQMEQKSIYDINKLQCENAILQSQLDAARNPERELKPPF